MDKKTIIDTIMSNTKEIDFSDALRYTGEIQAFVESNAFEYELKSFVEGYRLPQHKNIVLLSPDKEAGGFTFCLRYLCFVPMEIVAKNDYLYTEIQKGKSSSFFISLDELQQRLEESHKIGSYIINLPVLAVEVITTMVWNFINEFMTELRLGKNTSKYQQDKISGKKEIIHIAVKPLSSIQKSWKDSLRQIKKKQDSGEPIIGQNQEGLLLVSDAIKRMAEELKIKDFNLEKDISELGKVSQGLIPESLKHLVIAVVGKPSRSDTRRLYDQLFFFYQKMNPLDDDLKTLEKRLECLGKDEKLIAKETSLYYEFLGRKMRRYFGIEFIKIT
jgi:hypothetical protein